MTEQGIAEQIVYEIVAKTRTMHEPYNALALGRSQIQSIMIIIAYLKKYPYIEAPDESFNGVKVIRADADSCCIEVIV